MRKGEPMGVCKALTITQDPLLERDGADAAEPGNHVHSG